MSENQVFTDEQINEIISIFIQHMGHRQYIGARYVPIFGRVGEESIEWDNTGSYEPLTIVLYQGNSYTSRQYVPAGVAITNNDYWAETGNYNAQIEQYRQEVASYSSAIETLQDDVITLNDDIGTLETDLRGEITTLETNLTDEITAFETETNAQLDTMNTRIANISSAKSVPYITLGQIVYEHHNGMVDHPGAICEDPTGQVIISSPCDDSASSANGHFRRINIVSNNDYWSSAVSGDYGHSNSICYSEELGCILYAPLRRVSNGTTYSVAAIEKLSSAGAIAGSIPTNDGGAPYAVSYDPIRGKTYCFAGIDENTVAIYEYSPDTQEFTNTGVTFSNKYVSPNSLRQDVAVYGGIFYAVNINGVFACGTIDDGNIFAVRTLVPTNDMQVQELVEIDGIEFTANGIMLSIIHSTTSSTNASTQRYLTVASVIEILMNETNESYYPYADVNVSEPGYTRYVDPSYTGLRSHGTSPSPYKSLYQLQLGTKNPVDAYIISNYNADLIFIYTPLCLHPGANVVVSCDILRIGCDASLGGGNSTGMITVNTDLIVDRACTILSFLNSTKFTFPASYVLTSNGHQGGIYIINNGVTFVNTVLLGSTTVVAGNRYFYAIGFGSLNS